MVHPEIQNIAKLTSKAIDNTANLFESNFLLNNHKILAQYFLSKTVTSFYAVWVLCENGYGQDAFVVLRTMFENLVNLSFINKDPATMVTLFIEYDYIKDYRRLRDYERLYPDKPKIDTDREIISNYKRVKPNYPDENRWSRVTLFDMAKCCELESYYYMVYRLGSVFSHGGFDCVHDYINRKETHFSIRLGQPSDDKINLALTSACSIVMIVVEKTCNVFNLSTPEACSNILDHINNLKKFSDIKFL